MHLGRYPLVVDPIIDVKRLTKVLMVGGSGLNIMYAETLDAMGIDQACIRPTRAPFHGIMLGKQAILIGQIDLPITFENLSNYRIETFTFERAYECEVESYELASMTLTSEELAAIRKDITEGALDVKRVARSFEPTENIKEVLVDPDNSTNKMVCIGTALSPK
ncbi:uncharacterized protein [Miscanthus floridulus]|uniref:uncharacterized protein n=1 Tax=Miscanthus floridulus TaxID=154761 RepID=UPI00345B05FB